MHFARENTGKNVRIYVENDVGGKKMIGANPLISFEGDCDGNIVNGVKIVAGEEGSNPANVFHFIKSPQKISIEENEETGEIEKITLVSGDGITTTLEITD